MKLAIGNDHVAVEMKNEIKAYLEAKGIEVINVGTDSHASFNYPISGYKVGKMVASGEVDGGVLICGTGVGISLAANKVDGVRCCVCSEPYSAKMSNGRADTRAVSCDWDRNSENDRRCMARRRVSGRPAQDPRRYDHGDSGYTGAESG